MLCIYLNGFRQPIAQIQTDPGWADYEFMCWLARNTDLDREDVEFSYA